MSLQNICRTKLTDLNLINYIQLKLVQNYIKAKF